MKHTVVFQPSGRRGTVEAGVTLLEAAHKLGVDLESPCGAARTCGKCKVRIEAGFLGNSGIESKTSNLSPILDVEREKLGERELLKNYRLACCSMVQGDVQVFVPEESRGAQQVILETGRVRDVCVDPVVKNYYIELIPPTLEDQTDDFMRIKKGLRDIYDLHNIEYIE